MPDGMQGIRDKIINYRKILADTELWCIVQNLPNGFRRANITRLVSSHTKDKPC